jgi:tRNA (guanine37-N1)-methyltransferase
MTHKLKILEKRLQIQRDPEHTLHIPLTRQPNAGEIALLKAELTEFLLEAHGFEEKKAPEKNLAEALAYELPPHLLASLPRALDVVGDIAVVEIPSELEQYKRLVGEGIMKTHRNVRVVLAKAGAISGTFRLRDFEFLAGEQRTSTVYRENGCTYIVDVAKAYFSPRLSHEHQRVAALVQEGEVVTDLFAGVGPFAVLIAKQSRAARVYAIDINADAVDLLRKNVRLNRVENRVYPIEGDARKIVNEKLTGIADRTIMNLPETANEFVDVACKAVKPSGGVVHFYGFVRLPLTLEDLKESFSKAVEKAGRKVEAFQFTKTVRATAPYEYQVVLDACIS